MKVFFDRNLSPLIADFFGAYFAMLPGEISAHSHHHIFGRDEERKVGFGDTIWHNMIINDGTFEIIFSNDLAQLNKPNEQDSLAACKCHVFNAVRLIGKMTAADAAAALFHQWPNILKITETQRTGYFEIATKTKMPRCLHSF